VLKMDDDYSFSDDSGASEDHEIPAKKKTKRNPKGEKNKVGRPPKTPKYVFNVSDKEVMEKAVKKYGTSYATIAKEYFSDRNPPVTRTDIYNFVNSNEHLKKYCQTEHKKLKEAAHKKFLNSHTAEKFEKGGKDGKDEKGEKSFKECREEGLLLFPKPFGAQGSYIAPNVNFLATPPFMVKKESVYVYFYRLHLAQDLDIDYDENHRLLKFEVISNPTLLPFEREKTKLFQIDSEFQAIDKEETLKTICHMQVPEDGKLDDSIRRYDHDTETGALIEVHVLRRKEFDKSCLKGNRYRHMNVNVQTKQALQHNPEPL